MFQYYVTEVRKTSTGEFEHDNYWVYDENEQTARLKGEGKFHEVLSRAATSTFATERSCLLPLATQSSMSAMCMGQR